MTHPEQILNLSASPSAEACWWETKTYKAFVLSFWAFVSSVEGEEEAGHLRNSPFITQPWPLFFVYLP